MGKDKRQKIRILFYWLRWDHYSFPFLQIPLTLAKIITQEGNKMKGYEFIKLPDLLCILVTCYLFWVLFPLLDT